jgi:hypothetical protein
VIPLLTVACEMGHHRGCYKGRHNGCDSPHLHWCECPCHPYSIRVGPWDRIMAWLSNIPRRTA